MTSISIRNNMCFLGFTRHNIHTLGAFKWAGQIYQRGSVPYSTALENYLHPHIPSWFFFMAITGSAKLMVKTEIIKDIQSALWATLRTYTEKLCESDIQWSHLDKLVYGGDFLHAEVAITHKKGCACMVVIIRPIIFLLSTSWKIRYNTESETVVVLCASLFIRMCACIRFLNMHAQARSR